MDERGTVKVKPVYIGIHHYRYVYGSVCSSDVQGTPPIPPPRPEELERAARRMVEDFREGLDLDFVRVEEPFLVREQRDIRKLTSELTYDMDALSLIHI